MTVKQLSVFVENRAGRLSTITRLLGDAGVNIRAMSIADTKDFGILRLIVDDSEGALKVLKENVDKGDIDGAIVALLEKNYERVNDARIRKSREEGRRYFDTENKTLQSLRFVPMVQNYSIHTLEGDEKDRLLGYMRSLSPKVEIDDDGYVTKRETE